MKRNEIPEIPITALREAIVNSFAHRDIKIRKVMRFVFLTTGLK